MKILNEPLQNLLDAGLIRERQVGSTERFELNQRRISDVVLKTRLMQKSSVLIF